MTRVSFSHHDRVVVVTGGGTGLGRGIATAFAEAGARVLVLGRRETPLRETAAALGGEPRIAWRTADVTRLEDLEAAADDAVARWGRIDVWVNNAGILERGTLPDANADHLRRLLAVNVEGVFLGCKVAVERLRRNPGGVVLNVASYLASHAGASGTLPVYAASKGALLAMTKSLAVFHGPEGIRVNTISPALVPTELNERDLFEGHPDRAAREAELGARYPLGRVGRPADIGAAAIFLASDEAAWITGHDLAVDGGISAI